MEKTKKIPSDLYKNKGTKVMRFEIKNPTSRTIGMDIFYFQQPENKLVFEKYLKIKCLDEQVLALANEKIKTGLLEFSMIAFYSENNDQILLGEIFICSREFDKNGNMSEQPIMSVIQLNDFRNRSEFDRVFVTASICKLPTKYSFVLNIMPKTNLGIAFYF